MARAYALLVVEPPSTGRSAPSLGYTAVVYVLCVLGFSRHLYGRHATIAGPKFAFDL
jgi:hypothetical protein